MIDVLKRLADLDEANPTRPEYKLDHGQNISTIVAEHMGDMGMMGGLPPSEPHTPATVTITANSGEELSDMLSDILTLAGRGGEEHAEPEHSEEPAIAVDVGAVPPPAEPEIDGDPMVKMIDKLNQIDRGDDGDEGSDDEGPGPDNDHNDEETDECYDNVPNNPNDYSMKNDAELSGAHNRDQSGAPGAARGRNFVGNPVASTAFEALMAEYKDFVNEGKEKVCKKCDKPMNKCKCKE